MSGLRTLLSAEPYAAYSYAYPHKTAYRPLDPPVPLRQLWPAERRQALFLYLHVPFCEMRCGFCNLFTQARPAEGLEQQYLRALRRQAQRVGAALGEAGFARLAIGGGTPTYLEPAGLHELFDVAEGLGARPRQIGASVEVSPETATAEKLAVLAERGADRVSIGVQSFVEAEVAAAGRSQTNQAVRAALERIRKQGFPTLNVDLIYGLPLQTPASWLQSVRAALEHEPEELFLYPLYVRPLTGLDRTQREAAAERLRMYREARALLLDAGYTQFSMRCFRAAHAPAARGPVYCCQSDGMVGLGSGARSYTSALHYSGEYAVGARGVREIVAAYLGRPAESFEVADYGFRLDPDEQRRRHAIQSLLCSEGLDGAAYARRFGTSWLQDLPQLLELEELGLAVRGAESLRLTAAGLEQSDVIGPWLYSGPVRERMAGYELR